MHNFAITIEILQNGFPGVGWGWGWGANIWVITPGLLWNRRIPTIGIRRFQEVEFHIIVRFNIYLSYQKETKIRTSTYVWRGMKIIVKKKKKIKHVFFLQNQEPSKMIILSLVTMTGLENCFITFAYLQGLCHSGEPAMVRGPLFFIFWSWFWSWLLSYCCGC